MFLTCLEKPSIFTPFPVEVYGGSVNCCYTVDCLLKLDPAQPPRTITNLSTDFTSGCPFNILEVNGQIYTNPIPAGILVTQSTPIQIKIEICPCSGVGLSWNADFIIDYTDAFGAGTETITYGFTEINPAVAGIAPVDPTLTDWNIFPCLSGTGNCNELAAASNNLNTQSLPVTNHSDFDIPIVIADGGNFPLTIVYYVDGVVNTNGNTIIIPPKTTVVIGVGFCSPSLTPSTFDIDVVLCDVYAYKVDVNLYPVTCIGCGIGCNDIEIQTEASYLPSVSLGCSYALPSIHTESAIGDKKTIIWKYTYNNGFVNANFDLYFNPILWTDIQSVLPVDPYQLPLPTSGWYIKILDSMVGNPPYNMYQLTAPSNSPSQKNWEVQVELPNYNELRIYFTFYMTMDIDDKITNTTIENTFRFIKAQIADSFTNQTLSPLPNVYNLQRFLSKELFFVDNNVSDPTSTIDRPFRCFLYRAIPMASRWFNRGLYGNPSEFQNPTFTYFRDSQFWPASFSIFEKTEVTFEVDLPGGAVPTNMVAFVFDNVANDNSVDFVSNYSLSRANILTNALPATIDGQIESPSQAPTNIGGNRWQIKFMVGTGLNASNGYSLGVIVYDFANEVVNTFTAGTSIPVDTNPSQTALCCPLDIDSEWSDYITTYANVYPFVTPYKQRLRNKVVVEGGLFASQCLFDFGFTGDWLKLIVDVKLDVYAQRVLNATQVAKFMYYQYQSIRQAGYPFDFNNLSPDFTAKDTGLGQLELTWEGRGRWESNIVMPASNVYVADFVNSPWTLTAAGNVGNAYVQTFNISYDWANASAIFLQYTIKFDLSSILNLPNNQPFYLNKVILERLDCVTEEPITPPNVNMPDAFSPLVVEGWTGAAYVAIVAPVCPGDYEHIRVTLTSLNPADAGYVIGFISRPPYGLLNLKEDDETGTSPNNFTQLDDQYIYNVSPGVQVGTWEYYIDINSMPAGNYQICALYLPL